MKLVRWLPEARLEVADAARYFGELDEALGIAFYDLLEEQLQLVARFPESGTLVSGPKHRQIRRALIDRFKFSVEYALLGDDIFIIAVHHQARRPGYWRPRLAKVRP